VIASIVGGAVIFGCAGFCGVILAVLVCGKIAPLEDSPHSRKVHPAAVIAGAALFGIVLALRLTPVAQLGLSALICVPLAAAWYSDSLRGVIPDAFTLGPLAIVAGYVIITHSWWIALSAVVPFVPFAIAAAFSKGRGMGWGDVKLVALGGAVLGMQASILVFALACFAATAVSVIRDRGKSPIAFGPYLVAAVILAMAVQEHG